MSDSIFEYKLGALLRDTITGFTGIVIGRTEWQFGCLRYSLQPQALHEGVPIEAQAFDEQQLELVDLPAEVIRPERKIGGPKPTPRRW